MSSLTENGTPSKPVTADFEKHLAWLNRELILDSTPLNVALDQLARWYDLQFELPDPVYNNVKVTGTFKKKSIDHILEALGYMTDLDFERDNNKVVFFKRNR